MRNLIFIISILIILFKTGNVLSNNNIFNVNNIEITKEISKNKEKIVNQSFQKAFDLDQIKKLISYYQIISPETNNEGNTKVNVFFDKEKMHNFFYTRDILYADILNTEIILFPLLKKDKKYFIYTQNYFYKNWKNQSLNNLIQYILPVESLENIEKINLNIDNIYKLNISDFFKEYDTANIIFASIEMKSNAADIFLKTRIDKKNINKTLSIKNNEEYNEEEFYKNIILKINKEITDLIKSQNLIDVRTPSFLNAQIELNNKSNLVEFNDRIKKIGLIDSFYVQQLNKNFVLVKIKFFGKIGKIIKKLEDQDINLKMIEGSWRINII